MLISTDKFNSNSSQVRPGITTKNADGSLHCKPIKSRVLTMYTEGNDLQFAVPGGLIGVGTKIEPTLCIADRLVGQVSVQCSHVLISF